MKNKESRPAGKRLSLSHDKIKIQERISQFFDNVNKDGQVMTHVKHLGKCWEWKLKGSYQGYGIFKWFGKANPAHRVSWMIHNGEFDESIWICHRCDNKKCIRDSHLFKGDPKANSDDMIKKGRRWQIRGKQCTWARFPELVVGENNAHAKLTNKKVIQIRKYLKNGILGKTLALKFEVSRATISLIKNRKHWPHI